VPLRQTILALALILFGSTTPAFAQQSRLPATLPGLGRDEGTFLVTASDDGGRLVYFIAQNARHAVLDADLQVERQLNPLWPVRNVDRQEVLAYPEGEPVGTARAGLLGVAVAEAPAAADEPEVVAETISEPETEAADAPPTATSTYVLRPGDNLTYIARDHGTTLQAILQANGISNPNRIYAGQPLVIPGSAGVAEAVAEEPNTETVVAEQPSTDEVSLDEQSQTYVVKPGDSAIGIARSLNVDVDQLLAANAIANRNRIYAGQVLTVPAQSS